VVFRGIRTRLLVVVVATVTVALVAATFGFTFLLRRSVANSVDSVLRQRVNSERSVLAVRHGTIVPRETGADTLPDGRIWVFQGRKPIDSPRAQPATLAAVRSLVGGGHRFLDVGSTDERLYAAPIAGAGGRRIGTIVAGISIAAYEETRHAAFVGSVIFAVVLLALVAAASWWLLRSALRPVARMTEQAEAWSEHDLSRRFAAGEPHDEISNLAATLDRLLDRIGASLRHERRFTAELSHEVRTPLSRAIGEAELALRRERPAADYRSALELVLRNARQVARIVDALVAAAQHEASPRTGTADAYDVADDVVSSFEDLATEHGVALSAIPPRQPLRIGVDHDLAVRILQPIVENACRYGRRRVSIDIAEQSGQVVFHVADDGPGVDESERESIFEPGARGTAGAGLRGAGLGLALARRIARSASGDVVAAAGGFEIRLPPI
jgi:signal transduction histidine kinase